MVTLVEARYLEYNKLQQCLTRFLFTLKITFVYGVKQCWLLVTDQDQDPAIQFPLFLIFHRLFNFCLNFLPCGNLLIILQS